MNKIKPLSRSKLRQAAKLSMAIHGYDLMQGFSYKDVSLTEEEYQVMTEEAHKIAEKLAGNNPMTFGSVDEIIEYFKSNHPQP